MRSLREILNDSSSNLNEDFPIKICKLKQMITKVVKEDGVLSKSNWLKFAKSLGAGLMVIKERNYQKRIKLKN